MLHLIENLDEDSGEEEGDEDSFRTKQLFSFAWQIAKGMVITVIFYCSIFYKTCPGGMPIMAYKGRIRPKRVPFLGFLHERVGISLVLKCMKGYGNLSFRHFRL